MAETGAEGAVEIHGGLTMIDPKLPVFNFTDRGRMTVPARHISSRALAFLNNSATGGTIWIGYSLETTIADIIVNRSHLETSQSSSL
jgi:hypothetical protein